MKDDQDYQDLERYLKLYAPAVKRNLEIVSVDENPSGVMLHIDIEGTSPKKFFPKLSNRAADSENANVPRITVADTLIGCMIAYSSIYFDFGNDKAAGYEINAFTYKYCLKPTAKLVYDQEATGEHWLVGYNAANSSYVPKRLGTFFVVELTASRGERNGVMVSSTTRTEIAIEAKERFLLQPDRWLEPGHYMLTFEVDLEHRLAYDDKDPVKIKKISSGEFMKYKQKHAPDLALEHLTPQVASAAALPSYAKW